MPNLEGRVSERRPFYWIAPACIGTCDCAPTGWYQCTDHGLIYLGASILGDPDDVCKCGALRKDHGASENHAFSLDEFPSQQSTESVSAGVSTARDNDQRLVKGGGSHGE